MKGNGGVMFKDERDLIEAYAKRTVKHIGWGTTVIVWTLGLVVGLAVLGSAAYLVSHI